MAGLFEDIPITVILADTLKLSAWAIGFGPGAHAYLTTSVMESKIR